MRSGRVSWRPNTVGLVTLALCGLAWEMAIRGGLLRYQYLPAPSSIALGASEIVANGELAAATLHTIVSVLLGWVIAVALGVALGLLLGCSPFLRRNLMTTIEVLRPMPAVAFVPMALLLFGFSIQTELVVIILPSVWPVLINTMGGLTDIHPRLEDVARTFRLTRTATFCRVFLPAATPAIMVGVRLSLSLAVVLAVVAEMVGNPEGLGYAVVSQQQALRPDRMFAYVIVVGLLGIVLNALLVGLVSALLPAASTEIRELRT